MGSDDRTPRPEKVAVVDEVRERFAGARAAMLTEYRGLDVTAMAELRRALREAGSDYKVYKNTLVRLAVADMGIDELQELLIGPTAIAFTDTDAVGMAKALKEFAKTNENLVIKGGLLGDQLIDAEAVSSLADLPSREELLARLAAGLASPMQQMASVLGALPRKFAYAMAALIEKSGESDSLAADEEAVAEAPAEEAAEAPAEEAVAEAPAEEAVAEAPAEEAVAEPPAEEAVAEPPAEETTDS